MNYLFSKLFQLPLTGTFKNCTITYPYSHNKFHILRLYKWDLLSLVFCKQTSFALAAIGTLTHSQTSSRFLCLQNKSFENTAGKKEIAQMSNFSFYHSVLYPVV